MITSRKTIERLRNLINEETEIIFARSTGVDIDTEIKATKTEKETVADFLTQDVNVDYCNCTVIGYRGYMAKLNIR